MLFSAYRLDQYPDPDGFMVQATLVLSEYPEEVICHVTDPRTGIQRQNKWPPTIEEIAAACDARLNAIARQKELDAWHEKRKNSVPLQPKFSAVAGQITYAEFLANSRARGVEGRPVGRFESQGK